MRSHEVIPSDETADRGTAGEAGVSTKPIVVGLLVGELEADVNNGGFSQYLDNEGRRRARAALAAL